MTRFESHFSCDNRLWRPVRGQHHIGSELHRSPWPEERGRCAMERSTGESL